MSFTHIQNGSYGDEKVTSSARIGDLPLGARMVLPDGRLFVHAKAAATALVAGSLYEQADFAEIAGTADTGLLASMVVASNAAAAATTVSLTMGGTSALAKDVLRDGYLFVNGDAGEGHVYKIKGNAAAASVGTLVVNLEENDSIKVALAAGTTDVGLRQNEYDNVKITIADTTTFGTITGVAPVAVTAAYYCWLQRRGPAAVVTDGTLIAGEPVCVSKSLAGAITVVPASTTVVVKDITIVGWCMNVAASTEFSLVNLSIE